MGYRMEMRAIEEDTSLRVKCPYCGRKNHMPVYVDEKLCYWCKRMIKNNSRAYFKYRLRKELKKNV